MKQSIGNSFYGKTFVLMFILVSIGLAQGKELWCPLLPRQARAFSIERLKTQGLCGKKLKEWCLFPARFGIFFFIVIMIKVLFPFCTFTWGVKNYVSRERKGINRRNKSTSPNILICMDDCCSQFCNSVDCY